ncbi:hypothetical protein WR25_04267 isoform F [Diploscapter pachys]|nr:hypothetical protein WR25_04267 isoform B [Diploscapter pachys]PAV67776.1 hypothetical protein WR25_04267 isoform D [Diploscapter pachys]PAV67778.1 hypothetical protein WR25_04267 isoform F [Diploscapter pachys]
MDEERCLQYLKANPYVLEALVTGPFVSRETFQKWAKKRDQKARVLYELGRCCEQLLCMNDVTVVMSSMDGAFQVTKNAEGEMKIRKLRKPKKAPYYVQKVVDCSETILGELHFNSPVTDRDLATVSVISTWAAATHYFAKISSQSSEFLADDTDKINRQRKLSNFLLEVAKSIFQDIISMDLVIMKIMNFAQKLVNADRASLFLLDTKTKELYARIFDVGTNASEHQKLDEDGAKDLRFPMNKGIAGYVATTGQVLNIENAYEDSRFNPEVDSKTGYTTRNILCMPIFIRGTVIGVVQMVNKIDGHFNRDDEDAFEMFAVYCGLALHHAKLYDKIRRSEQKYRVALEVLAYHSVCNKDEVNKLKKIHLTDRVSELETFDFNGMKLSELEKPLYAVYMFKALFQTDLRFDPDDLIRFVLTVRKNYRRVAYHNWAHGWSVAHAMFVLLFVKKDIFTPHEALALYVSCLCHDLDHRGKNNAYMKTMSTPLAAIYTTSVMEHHHFNQTVTILQQNGHNILKSMSSEEYKQALGLIKHCILATDLALFFPNKAKLNDYLDNGTFNIHTPEHR